VAWIGQFWILRGSIKMQDKERMFVILCIECLFVFYKASIVDKLEKGAFKHTTL